VAYPIKKKLSINLLKNTFFVVKMNRLLLIIISALISTSSAAAWVKVGTNKTVTVYAHPETIRRITPHKVKMWSLYDYKTTQESIGPRPYMSLKLHDEYDCKKEHSKILYSITHSENMGGGRSLYSRKYDMVPTPISSGRIIQQLWKFACGK
jgi:hypothetical protein